MDLATALIWLLRVALPIILFCIYFKFQLPKDEALAGPTGRSYSRGQLLAQRGAPGVPDAPVPPALATLTLKDQGEAPELFMSVRGVRATHTQGAGSRGERSERREGRRAEKFQQVQREHHQEQPRAAQDTSAPEATTREFVVPEAAAEEVAAEATPMAVQNRMHVESFLNYVAFHPKEQRVFLSDEAPPPPPIKNKPKPEPAFFKRSMTAAEAEKANEEAQLVLLGAIKFKRSNVAKELYTHLAEAKAEISAQTFALMIEACVQANDLKSATDLLMKMETSGYTPDGELLDKVMDLYSTQKTQKEQEKEQEQLTAVGGNGALSLAEMTAAPAQEQLTAVGGHGVLSLAEMTAAAAQDRAKLSSSAAVFVPSFGIPPPPPKSQRPTPPAAAGKAERHMVSPPAAPVPVPVPAPRAAEPPAAEKTKKMILRSPPTVAEARAAEAAKLAKKAAVEAKTTSAELTSAPPRTKLVASSMPFQPQFMQQAYDPTPQRLFGQAFAF